MKVAQQTFYSIVFFNSKNEKYLEAHFQTILNEYS